MKKIVQIIPAPPGWWALYATLQEDGSVTPEPVPEPVPCFALVEEDNDQVVVPLVNFEDTGIGFPDEAEGYRGLVWSPAGPPEKS